MRYLREVAFFVLLAAWLKVSTASTIFVGSPGYIGIDVYDTAAGTKIGAVSTGQNVAYGIGFASSSSLFVASPSYSGFAVYDASSGLQTTFVNLPFAVAGIAVGSNSKLYLTSGGFTGIWVYDLSTFTYTGQIASPNSYAGLAFGPGGVLLAGSTGFNGLQVFDVSSNLMTGIIAIPNVTVSGLAYDNAAAQLFIGSPGYLGIDVYDSSTMSKTDHISFQSSAYGLAVRPAEVSEPGTLALLAGAVGLFSLIGRRWVASEMSDK